jgi:hypothetical protein
MGAKVAAIGFKAHTGWATFVAVSGTTDKLEVHARGRAELLPPDESIPRFVYHEASQLSDARAQQFVDAAVSASKACAASALTAIIEDLRLRNIDVQTCALISGNSELKPGLTLEAILQSHPLIHASEGKLFRDAIIHACFERGLNVVAIPERDVWGTAAKAQRRAQDDLRGRVSALRAVVGPPWGADEKTVTAAAIAAFSAQPGVRSRRLGKEPICH